MCDREFLHRYAQKCPVTGYWLLCPDNAARINHALDANMGAGVPLADPARTDCALRDIAEGEEITCNYEIGDVQPFYGFNDRALPASVFGS